MEQKKINTILAEHKKWLEDSKTGEKANLRYASLSNNDLRNANLECADLKCVDLRHAGLEHANLAGAKLRYANLAYANLRNADLAGADLIGADLRGANLRNTDLRNTDLRHADLGRANLKGAKLDYSCLPLWCGGLDFKIDEKQAKQLMYHVINLMQYSEIDTSKVIKKKMYEWLEDSHLVTQHELPILKEKNKEENNE